MSDFLVEDKFYTLSEIHQCVIDGFKISVSKPIKEQVVASYKALARAISSGETIYGVNTGFGKLSQVKIEKDKMQLLQDNLLKSHAAGVGPPAPNIIVKMMIKLD